MALERGDDATSLNIQSGQKSVRPSPSLYRLYCCAVDSAVAVAAGLDTAITTPPQEAARTRSWRAGLAASDSDSGSDSVVIVIVRMIVTVIVIGVVTLTTTFATTQISGGPEGQSLLRGRQVRGFSA